MYLLELSIIINKKIIITVVGTQIIYWYVILVNLIRVEIVFINEMNTVLKNMKIWTILNLVHHFIIIYYSLVS